MSASQVIIVGATSGMGQAIARHLASEKKDLLLLGRDKTALDSLASDCEIRFGVKVRCLSFEATNYESHIALFSEEVLNNAQGAILCQGYLGDNLKSRDSLIEWKTTLEVNFLSVVSCLTPMANAFEKRGSGFLCVIGSVAGVRGRQSNYVYGSAKGAVSVFLEGLRHRLSKGGVAVTEIRPGFVDTAMTFGLPGLFLVARPEKVARDILKAIEKKRAVAYTPWFWWGIMTIIRCLPRFIFHKSKL